MTGPHGSARTVPKRKGSPSRREIEHVEAIRQAADDLAGATDYAQTYMARVALDRAMRSYFDWVGVGRPHV